MYIAQDLMIWWFDDLMIWDFCWIEHRGAEPKMPDSRVANMRIFLYYYDEVTLMSSWVLCHVMYDAVHAR